MADNDRDEMGRFVKGNSYGGKHGGGRPPLAHVERVRAALSAIVTDEVLERWAAAMKRRIAKGELPAAEFVFDRIMGKPVQAVDIAATLDVKLYQQVSPDDWDDNGGPS